MDPVIGIDPGISGGIALVADDHVVVYEMPETERDLWDCLQELRTRRAARAAVELVRSSPQMGVVSAFTFGRGMGGLRMALIGLGIPFEEVSPGKWQRALSCLSKGDKNVTKRKAQELYPAIKVTHAIADALLIATWARRS